LTLKRNAVDFMAHEYTVEIGFQGTNLDIDFLTSFLDLTPSMARKKKAADSKGAGAITGIWKPDSKRSGIHWRKVSFYIRKNSRKWVAGARFQ